MTVYGGFDPGVFQPWALNLQQKSLGQPGIGYGMQVTPATPASMNVLVNVDGVAGDGVCFLPNGAWLRIDANATLGVPANTSGLTRTDAVVAYVDPTGTTAAGLYYVTGWSNGFAASGNSLPLAQVNVPNGASSVVASNIVETPLLANAGGGSSLLPDAVVGDNSNTYAQPGVFAEYNIVLTSSALTNQTTFAVPLTQLQRLVPQGRIGGTREIGFFAGPHGWYTPRIYGSASGELPVSSVDAAGGNIIIAVAAQSGETVYASFKYYDFGQDVQPLGGVRIIPIDSPYCVYQSECTPAGGGKIAPLFSSTQAFALQAGDSVFVTTHVASYCALYYAVYGPATFSTWTNGTVASSNVGAEYNSALSPYTSTTALWPTGTGPNLFQYQCESGSIAYGGATVGNWPGTTQYTQDGGEVTVNGRTIVLNNASVTPAFNGTVPAGGMLSGYLYVDQHGNLGNTLGAQSAERFAGRIPVVSALQYNSNKTFGLVNMGIWSPQENPYDEPAQFSLGSAGGNANPSGWSVVADSNSPYGVGLQSTTLGDMFSLLTYASGLDMVAYATVSTPFEVTVAGVTNYPYWVNPTTGYVGLTVATNLPPKQNVIQVNVTANGTNFRLTALDLRWPASTPPRVNATPLAEVSVNDYSIRRATLGTMTGLSITTSRTSAMWWTYDVANGVPNRYLSFDNVSTDQSITVSLAGYSTVRPIFVGGPVTGKVLVQVGAWTATIDTYTSTWSLVTSSWVSASFNQWSSMTIQSTGTRNTSSGGTVAYLFAADTFQHPLHVKDARQWANDGYHPSALGSGILSAEGRALPSQFGIGTYHLQDRSVTSRKMQPTWQYTQATTTYSSSPTGTWVEDVAVRQTVTVDSPSLLYCQAIALMQTTGATYQNMILGVDGQLGPMESGISSGAGTSSQTFNCNTQAIFTVGPGTHQVQLFFLNGGGASFPNSSYGRNLSTLVFGL